MEIMTWISAINVQQIPLYPISFEWGFSCNVNSWACAYELLWSPGNISWKGKKNLTFIDDFSKKTFLYTMKIKFGVFDKFKDSKLWWKFKLEKILR